MGSTVSFLAVEVQGGISLIMFNRYFQEELRNLKDLGEVFSKAHPALAPMLSGPTTDPDVGRLLEGVAFLTALLRQKLDDEFPEIIHELMQLIWPHYLRPIPSTAIVAFTPKSTLRQSMKIPSGIQVASVPMEGTSCLFKTAYDLEIHPLRLLEATFSQPSGKPPMIKLLLELNGLKLSDWKPLTLRLFLAGDYPGASDLYLILRRYLKRLVIQPQDKGLPLILSPDFLKPVGFEDREALLPYPSHSFPGYRILQEYFISPDKFLFLDITGLERWQGRGEGKRFEINFELDEIPFLPARIRKENFVLFATPVINLFRHEADPIALDHQRPNYLVRPSGSNSAYHQVYSVEKVIGFVQGTAEEKTYIPFEMFNPDLQSASTYHLTVQPSPIRTGLDTYLSVAYPPGAGPPVPETLSIQLQCTNGSLPGSLRTGDISKPTSHSPEFVEFRNIKPPTTSLLPPVGTFLLWRLLSHLSLNYLSLARGENLKALLELYIFPESGDKTATLANKKRIQGIERVEAVPSDRLVSGLLMRGQEIHLHLRQDQFAGQGDMFLFASVLDQFLGGYGSINTFTQLTVKEVLKGDLYQWPARLGNHPLI
jgi:type VI secretion system protein ImpG